MKYHLQHGVYKSLRRVVEYMALSEMRHFEENGGRNHIYRDVVRLAQFADSARPKGARRIMR